MVSGILADLVLLIIITVYSFSLEEDLKAMENWYIITISAIKCLSSISNHGHHVGWWGQNNIINNSMAIKIGFLKWNINSIIHMI